jgi:hypothetical protein
MKTSHLNTAVKDSSENSPILRKPQATKVKGKGEVRPITGREDPEGE